MHERKKEKMKKFRLKARIARKLPDPVHPGAERFVFFARILDTPVGMPKDPNARSQNIERRVYRDVKSSMLRPASYNEAGFHLKHKGITVIASKVVKVEDNCYEIYIGEDEGIVDGAHSYDLIDKTREDGIPDNQYIKWDVLVNVDKRWIVDISGGLNTSVQVQDMSLENLKGSFNWMKKIITDKPFSDSIAWRENEGGPFDARDLVAFLTMFNVFIYPNNGDLHPVTAYSSKSGTLKIYQENSEQYQKLCDILLDILTLHDIIQMTFSDRWNEGGGKAASLSFVESRKRGEFELPFIEKSTRDRLRNGALYPLLGSFRWMVTINQESGLAEWRVDFGEVKELWDELARELIGIIMQHNNELGRNPNALGKSKSLWSALHKAVAFRQLQRPS